MNVCRRVCVGICPATTCKPSRKAGWASIKNGKLLRLIADSGKFDVFLTVDKNLPHEQKIEGLPFAVVCCARNQIGLRMSFHSRRKFFDDCRSFNMDRFIFFPIVINAASFT
jgi:hypothetical protein